MTKNKKIEQLKAEIAIQRAEKAAAEATKSTQELQRLEKTLTSPQVKEATVKVVKQAAESAVDNIIKEKKINNEIKVKTANQLQQEAEGARKILNNKKKKKKTIFSRKNIFLFLIFCAIIYYVYNYFKNRKVTPKASPLKKSYNKNLIPYYRKN
jgi:ABC-type Na+ efflux pump permease subunit